MCTVSRIVLADTIEGYRTRKEGNAVWVTTDHPENIMRERIGPEMRKSGLDRGYVAAVIISIAVALLAVTVSRGCGL